MTSSTLPRLPRTHARQTVLRWVLVSLVLTGVIAMHVLSRHDAAGGHHGSIVAENAAVVGDPVRHGDHGDHGDHGVTPAVAAAASVAAAMTMPTAPGDSGADMAACILFLVIGAGALLLVLLTALRRRSGSSAARSSRGVFAAVPRGPPRLGPRISLCVLRV